jgi:hypothetical protein
MAAKKIQSKKTKKQHTPDYYPVQRRIPLGTTNAAQGHLGGIVVGDVGRLASIANRRLYRYGNCYRMKIDLDPSVANTSAYDVEVFALRNTWDVQRAFALAKKVYDEAYHEELDRTGTANVARWRDFRVEDGVAGGISVGVCNYDNANLANVVSVDGEFASSAVDDAGTEKSFTWGSATASKIDIVNEWIQAGRTGTDPNEVSTSAPYAGVNSDNMSDIEQGNLGNDGNKPPYSQDALNDQLVRVATLRYEPAHVGMQRLSTGFFDAPCGLFVLKTTAGVNTSNGNYVLTIQGGDYKGVMAHAMSQ